MSEDRQTPIERHLTAKELDEAEQVDELGSSVASVSSTISMLAMPRRKQLLVSGYHS